MLTRNLLSRESRHVIRQAATTTLAAGSTTKPKIRDPWGMIFDELPDSAVYSSLSNRDVKNLNPKDYFTKNRHSKSSFFSRNPLGGVRAFSTSVRRCYAREKSATSAGSMSMSGWDHVFRDFERTPFIAPAKKPTTAMSGKVSKFPVRRQTMTPREISAFDDMFNMLFNAIAPKTQQHQNTSVSSLDPSVGYTHFRERMKKMKWRIPRPLTMEEEQLLDEKKEDMELCYTDFELLQWAERELFTDSIERLRKFEDRHKEFISSRPELKMPISASTTSTSSMAPPPMVEDIQNPLYSPLLTTLMNVAIHKFGNTQLACTLFLHAANLSFPSFIHSCTTASFNVYLEALWNSTRDLRTVSEAVEEMHSLGVKRDNTTRSIVGKIRRELEATLKEVPTILSSPMLDRTNQIGLLEEAEIYKFLEGLDKLCAEDPSDLFFFSEEQASTPAWKEEWKANVVDSSNQSQPQMQAPLLDGLEDIGDDVFKPEPKTEDESWTFDDWDLQALKLGNTGGTRTSGYRFRPKKQLTHHFGSEASSDRRTQSTW
jgi:hypothetical protein